MAQGQGAQQVPEGHLGASGASSLRAPLVLLLTPNHKDPSVESIGNWKIKEKEQEALVALCLFKVREPKLSLL